MRAHTTLLALAAVLDATTAVELRWSVLTDSTMHGTMGYETGVAIGRDDAGCYLIQGTARTLSSGTTRGKLARDLPLAAPPAATHAAQCLRAASLVTSGRA